MISACNHVRSRSLVPVVKVRRKNLCLKRGSRFGWVVQRGWEERVWRMDARWVGESEVERSCFERGSELVFKGVERGKGGPGAERQGASRLTTYPLVNGSHSTPSGGASNSLFASSLQPAAMSPLRYAAHMPATCRLTMPRCTCARFEVDSAEVVYLV